VIELLFVAILRSLFGAVENVTSGIKGIIECILVNACYIIWHRNDSVNS
jgi:hypothetical protein